MRLCKIQRKNYICISSPSAVPDFPDTIDVIAFLNPYANALFLFCGRKKNTIKALHFDKDGFVLYLKRLDNGRFQLPKDASEVRPLNRQEFRWLMEGLSIEQPKAIKPVTKKKDF